MFAIYLYVYRKKEMTLKRMHSRTRVRTQVPPACTQPPEFCSWATSEVTQLGPLFHICSNSQRTCLHFCDLQCCNLCVYRRKQMRKRRSHPITRRQMNAPPGCIQSPEIYKWRHFRRKLLLPPSHIILFFAVCNSVSYSQF